MFTQQIGPSLEAVSQESPSTRETKHLGETQWSLSKGKCSQMIVIHFFSLLSNQNQVGTSGKLG